MVRYTSHNKIYRTIATTLEKISCKRDSLIKNVIDSFKLSGDELADRSVGSVYSKLRSRIGTVINEMQSDDLIRADADGYYTLTTPKPVVIRIERCEKEIIRALSDGEISKKELRARLSRAFGTHKTATHKDDERLYTYIGQVTRRLISAGAIIFSNGFYSLSPKLFAKVEDVKAILNLKSDFLYKLHEKGGEFFESYFMTLIKKHYEKQKKQILECYVTGGSMDGGIDGMIKTRDELGFIETILVQTKNRHELASETEVRGFYGAVRAANGSRGIFATTSGFHYSAVKFLDALDDCIGIDGEKIFALATELGYGIKKSGDKLYVDEKIL